MHIPDLPGVLDPDQPLALAAAFARMSQTFLRESSSEAELFERICEQSTRVVEADSCGVTIRRRRGRPETPAASSPLAARCEELQAELGEGPGLVSGSADQGHLVHDTTTEERWPRWCALVAELGVRSIVSAQLPAGGLGTRREPFGAVTLYGREPGRFGETHLLLVQVYAAHAANAIAHLRQVDGLARAAESRHVIGVAQGVLVQRYGLGVDQAFDVLQRFSMERNIKLRRVAEQVVADRALPGAVARAHPEEDELDLA